MPTAILTAKRDVSSPTRSWHYENPKDLKKGFKVTVSSRTNGSFHASHEEVIGALLLAGFCKEEAEHYDGGSWSNNFDAVEINKDPDFDLSSKQFQAQLNRDKYSFRNSAKNTSNSSSNNNEQSSNSSSRSSSSSSSSSCCGGFLKFIAQCLFTLIPVLPVWWLIKVFTKGGWYLLKAIGYIVSWPIRLLCCCFCTTRFLPESSGWPEYWFNAK